MHREFLITAATILSLLAGCGRSRFVQEYEREQGAVALARETSGGAYDLVTTDELARKLEAKEDLLLVDAMPFADSYRSEHIQGAVNFPFPIPEMKEWDPRATGGRSKEDFVALLGSDKQRQIVFYCGFVKCTRSHNAAVWAKSLGYSNVKRYPGGIFAWKGAGYPLTADQ